MVCSKRPATKKVWNQQLYVLALENALITHFAFEECDPRLANESLHPGKLQKSPSAGYVVYMAFKYSEKKAETEELHESSEHSEKEETAESANESRDGSELRKKERNKKKRASTVKREGQRSRKKQATTSKRKKH